VYEKQSSNRARKRGIAVVKGEWGRKIKSGEWETK
jgi:hypothetical protein